jgi:hypothetical protein
MGRGFSFLLAISALTGLAPAAIGQYPYPYGPMPVQYSQLPYGYPAPMPSPYAQPYGYPAPMPSPYAQPYRYPAPMPAYGPNPMMARPMYYAPAPMMQQAAPMWQAPAAKNTKVFVYGPLDETVGAASPNPIAAPPNPVAAPLKLGNGPSGVSAAQGMTTRGGARVLPTFSKADLLPEGCGPGCDDFPEACGPAFGPKPYEPPMRGRGHFIGEVGAYFLTPLSVSRIAYNTARNGGTTGTDFPQPVDWGARAWVGYMFHSGWGLRGGYEYLRGSIRQSIANADAATMITTPLPAPFQIVSPSAALNGGIGPDRFRFSQRLDLHVADTELLKETSFLDTTFLFSFGARYARMMQSYSATRTNPGGNNGAVTVALDRDDLDTSNRFEGWGPTTSFEAVHPLGCGFSMYGNVRGSFLWGPDRFAQNLHNQNRTVTAAGVATFTDTFNSNDAFDSRFVSILEVEAGVQYGHRFGRCYFFARAGGVFQRWWDVGNPTNANGSLNFLGGTVRAGITY